jgi:membrane protein insertase Oxa1/YidC/SpoIIIJ
MSSEVPTDIFTKLSVISPTSIYHGLNELFEVIISDVGTSCGVGWTILMVTVGIKLVYAPLMIKTNINTLKLKLLEPET